MSQGVVLLIILIAGFVVITMLVISFIHRSVQNKTVDAGNCVEGSNTYSSVNEEACSGSTAETGNNSFTKEPGYASRY